MKRFFEKKFSLIDKRYRFVISAGVMTLLMAVSTLYPFGNVFFFIPILLLLTYCLTYFSLLEGIEKIEWLTLFFMPLIVTVSFYLFYFLFPGRWLTRIPFLVLYAVSIYAVLLSSNIFNVGVEKNLQLYRAAFSVNYMYQTIVIFFLFHLIFSLQLPFFFNFLLSFVVSFILAIQLLWTIRLRLVLEKEIFVYALLISLVVSEIIVLLSFVPLNISVFALFSASLYYSLSGIIHLYINQRLFKETIREYIFVLAFVFIIMILGMSW